MTHRMGLYLVYDKVQFRGQFVRFLNSSGQLLAMVFYPLFLFYKKIKSSYHGTGNPLSTCSTNGGQEEEGGGGERALCGQP